MKKYANMYNELLLTAETKKIKRGSDMAAILKLIQDLTEFENNIQEAIDAQDIIEYKTQIQNFLNDIDKMYEVLFNMAKSGIQAMRNEREQIMKESPAEKAEEIEKIEKIDKADKIDSESKKTIPNIDDSVPLKDSDTIQDFRLMTVDELKNALKAVPDIKIPEPPKRI